MRKTLLILTFLLIAHPATFAKELERALCVSMIQEPSVLSELKSVDELIVFSKKNQITDIFFQAYRANRSLFASEHADDTLYREGVSKNGSDLFAILIEKAHKEGIKVHAWINLLSLSANEDAPILKKFGPTILTRNLKPKNELSDYKIDGQYFLEAADTRVRGELLALVDDLLKAYPSLDGVMLDYIRYPDLDPACGHTDISHRRFKSVHPSASWHEKNALWRQWKKDQVTDLVRLIAKRVKKFNPKMQVSSTGLMPYVRASEEAFQDWRFWLKHNHVDFVTLMCYVDTPVRFERWLKDAKRRLGDLSKIYIAIGIYEPETTVSFFRFQLALSEDSLARGVAIFHYANFENRKDLADIFLPVQN